MLHDYDTFFFIKVLVYQNHPPISFALALVPGTVLKGDTLFFKNDFSQSGGGDCCQFFYSFFSPLPPTNNRAEVIHFQQRVR